MDRRIVGSTSHSTQRVSELMWPNTTQQLTRIINEATERFGDEPFEFTSESRDPQVRLEEFIQQFADNLPQEETGAVWRDPETNGLQARLIGDLLLSLSYEQRGDILYLVVVIHCEGYHPEERTFMDMVISRLSELDPISYRARTALRSDMRWEAGMKY